MSFSFNFGEHFYEGGSEGFLTSLLVTLLGTFAGFFLALLAERKMEKRAQNQKELEDAHLKMQQLNYLKSILEAIISYVPKQLENYKKFSQNIRATPLEIIRPDVIASFELLRLQNTDNSTTQSAYLYFFHKTDNPYKDYKNIYAHGDFLSREFSSIEDQVIRATDFKHKDQLYIRDLLEDISWEILNRLEELTKTIPPQDLLSDGEFVFLGKLADSYGSITSKMMIFQEVETNFIHPILSDSLLMIKDKNSALKIFELARKANGRLINIRANALDFSSEILQGETFIQNALTLFEEENTKIKKLLS